MIFNQMKQGNGELRGKRIPCLMLCIIISIAMTVTMMPRQAWAAVQETGDSANSEQTLEEGTFVSGEVIVTFKEDAIKDKAMSLKSAVNLENIDDDFGTTMDAAGESKEAAKDAASEVKILEESLGGDFVIKDSISFDEDLTICLVSSDKYDTETMIEKLSTNEKVASAEANYYTQPQSVDYSLNDSLNQYAYHVNSPADNNIAGRNVTNRGTDAEKALSIRAGNVTPAFSADPDQDEVVVAVIDSGINYDHEDLQNVLWNNPGDIGLEGEHGFNFDDNRADVFDGHGHGTHVSGIIAAQANNGKGIAGVASGVNVKIMMLATSGSGHNPESEDVSLVGSSFRNTGAMYYVLRAKQRGVNVVAVNNSWGAVGRSFTYDAILNKLGEAGVITFFAATNDRQDNDEIYYCPAGTDSPYAIIVGSADITGQPSGFSNWGKANVDVFGPGSNILSCAIESTYFPQLYSASERADNTEYYGEFTSATEVGALDEELGTNRVVPETAGEGVKPFEAAKFFKQDTDAGEDQGYDPEDEPGEEGEPGDEPEDDPYAGQPEATCELSISTDKSFTNNCDPESSVKPATLKVTIKNARMSERYFLYFPYAKNHATTGIENIRYSLTAFTQHKEDEFNAMVYGGEVVKYEKEGGTYCHVNAADEANSRNNDDGELHQFTCNKEYYGDEMLLSWEDADPENTDVAETGIGVSVNPTTSSDVVTEEEREFNKGVHDITFYIDALGVSEPVTEEGITPDDIFPANSSYRLMSGTSQATPAAVGAYAVMTALYPKKEGQTYEQYASESRARYFSFVRQTDEMQDLCSTGGYIDLSLISEDSTRPSIADAVCDVSKGTLTLHGINLTKDLKLSCKRIAVTNAEEKVLPYGSMKVSFAQDGKTVTISGAKDLFGTYTEFLLRDTDNAVLARGSFFLTKGQKKLKKVLTEEHKETIDADDVYLAPRYIFSDTTGKNLYAYQMNAYDLYGKEAGVLYKYDGAKFVEYQGTKFKDSMYDYMEEQGYDRYQLVRGLEVTPRVVRQPICENNKLYAFVSMRYSPYDDAEEEDIVCKDYLAVLNYTAKSPKWQFIETESFEDIFSGIEGVEPSYLTFCALKGKIYCFGARDFERIYDAADYDSATFAFACDVKTGQWKQEASFPEYSLNRTSAYVNNGKIYLLFGFDSDRVQNNSVYCFDGSTLKKLGDIPFLGKTTTPREPGQGAVAPVKEGLMIFNYSADGAGNVYLYDTTARKCKPLYYTLTDGLTDPPGEESAHSAVETTDGIYYLKLDEDSGSTARIEMYLLPKSTCAYQTRYKDPNPLRIKAKTAIIKYSKLKKKTQTLRAAKVITVIKKGKGKMSYQLVSAKKGTKSFKKYFKISKSTGTVTVKKGLKKGIYKVIVKAKAAGNALYKASNWKAVTIRIKVK